MSAVSLRPPGPHPRWPAISFFAYRRDMAGFLTRATRDYGDVVYFKIGPQDVYFLNHPDYIKDVLVTHQQNFIKGRALQRAKRLLGEGLLTSEGSFHRRQRRLAQPAFHRNRIASYADKMTEYAERASDGWTDGAQLDMSEEMMRLTLAIVAKTLFDADVEEGEADEIGEALTTIMSLFNAMLFPFSEVLEKLPLPQSRRFKRAKKRLDETIYRIIDERRRSGEDRGDLLSMLLFSQDEEGTGSMTDEQVRDEVMTLFLAGHETTANALTWTWYLLSQHEEAEARLHQEVDEVLGGRARPLVEDVPRLRYTEMVLMESMRLYPPAWAIGRLAVKETEINGYRIAPGSLVLVSQYVTHRDPRYYPDPMRFDPERWTTEARETRPQFAYFPFGAGARRCIGEAFAWMEGVLLIATLARRWRLRHAPAHTVDIQPLITLRPKHGMLMTAHKRQN
jgi:cytochrome P450